MEPHYSNNSKITHTIVAQFATMAVQSFEGRQADLSLLEVGTGLGAWLIDG